MASEDIPANGHGGSATHLAGGRRQGHDLEAGRISEKERFRRDARARRRQFVTALDATVRRRLEDRIARRVTALLTDATIIAAYAPMGHEVDPAAAIRSSGARAALPWFATRDSPMAFRAADGSLEPGPFGTMQPRFEAAQVVPDVLLVPLVAADTVGNRIGQGKGHFDRTLAALRAAGPVLAIGLAWDVQIFDRLPADEWDQPLDAVVTPTRTLAR